jgi:hypothetical protein
LNILPWDKQPKDTKTCKKCETEFTLKFCRNCGHAAMPEDIQEQQTRDFINQEKNRGKNEDLAYYLADFGIVFGLLGLFLGFILSYLFVIFGLLALVLGIVAKSMHPSNSGFIAITLGIIDILLIPLIVISLIIFYLL